jgi:hypothetical protein
MLRTKSTPSARLRATVVQRRCKFCGLISIIWMATLGMLHRARRETLSWNPWATPLNFVVAGRRPRIAGFFLQTMKRGSAPECWPWKYGGVVSDHVGAFGRGGIGVGGRCQPLSVFMIAQLRRADRGTEKACTRMMRGCSLEASTKKSQVMSSESFSRGWLPGGREQPLKWRGFAVGINTGDHRRKNPKTPTESAFFLVSDRLFFWGGLPWPDLSWAKLRDVGSLLAKVEESQDQT